MLLYAVVHGLGEAGERAPLVNNLVNTDHH